jgi:hypothetical protein
MPIISTVKNAKHKKPSFQSNKSVPFRVVPI